MMLARNVEGSALAEAMRMAAYRRAQNVLKGRPC
jgi:hypothetical protein